MLKFTLQFIQRDYSSRMCKTNLTVSISLLSHHLHRAVCLYWRSRLVLFGIKVLVLCLLKLYLIIRLSAVLQLPSLIFEENLVISNIRTSKIYSFKLAYVGFMNSLDKESLSISPKFHLQTNRSPIHRYIYLQPQVLQS